MPFCRRAARSEVESNPPMNPSIRESQFLEPLSIVRTLQAYGLRHAPTRNLILGWLALLAGSVLVAALAGTGRPGGVLTVGVSWLPFPLQLSPFLPIAYLLAIWLGAEWATTYTFLVHVAAALAHGAELQHAAFFGAGRALGPAVVALLYVTIQAPLDMRRVRGWLWLCLLSCLAGIVGSVTAYAEGLTSFWSLEEIGMRWWGWLLGDTLLGLALAAPLFFSPQVQWFRLAHWPLVLQRRPGTRRMLGSLVFLCAILLPTSLAIAHHAQAQVEESAIRQYSRAQGVMLSHIAEALEEEGLEAQRCARGLVSRLQGLDLTTPQVQATLAEGHALGCAQEAAALLLAQADGTLLQRVGREDFAFLQLQTLARQMATLGPSTTETLVAAPILLESPRGNTWALPLAVGLAGETQEGGTSRGLLILLYDLPRWVDPHMEVVTIYGQAGLWFLDEAGHVLLAHRPPAHGETGERWDLHPLPPEIATIVSARLQRGALRRQEFRTGQHLVAATRLLWAGRQWWLLSATPREPIVGPAQTSYHHMTRLFLVVSILFFLMATSTIHVYRAFSTALRREARERTREVAALTEVSRTLAEAQDLESVLDAVLEQAIALVGKASGAVMMIDQARKTLRIVAHRGLSPETVQEFNERPVYLWEGTFAEVVRTGKPLEIPDAWSDARVLHEVGDVPPSLTNLPLKAGDRVIGIVAVDAVPPDDMARRLLQALADVASVAILRAQLYESERAKHQLALTLQDTARLLNSEMNLERLLDLILEQLERVVRYERAVILLQENNALHPTAVRGSRVGPEFLRFLRNAESLHHSQQVFRTRKPLVVPDVRKDAHWIPATPDDPVRCWMGAPLIHKGEPLGVLFTASDRPGAYGAGEMEILATFAAHAAVAIANARLYAEAQNRARELQSLQEITRAIAATLDAESMYRIVTKQAGNLVPSAWCGLARYLPEQEAFVLEAVSTHLETLLERGLALPAGEPPFAPLLEGAPAYHCALSAQASGWTEEALALAGARSLLALPLRVDDDLMGVLAVAVAEPEGFSPDHVTTLSELTTHLALALRNAELLASRQQALDELRAAQEQLVRSEKLRALGRMASGIAHNFNNTLAVILGRAQLAQRRTSDPEIQADLQAIVRAAQDGASTVRRLREYTRMEPVPPGPISTDLNEVVRTVVDVTRPRWKDEPEREGHPVQVVIEAGEVPPVPADAGELREVLTNMIFNAVDAMPSGGTITLRTRQEGDWAILEVQDTGIGMSEEVRRRVFDPFFTTKGPGSAGLGLSTSYGIVRRHGGNIEVQSMLGQGTTFTIRLPTAAAAPAAAPSPEPVAQASRPGHILVVDDDPEVRETLSRVLVLGDHRVSVAEGGFQALELLAAERPDMVLTDLGMPGMSGWELASHIHQAYPGLPVALITGWGEEVDPEEASRRHVCAVISKPFDVERILKVVAALLEQAPRGPS